MNEVPYRVYLKEYKKGDQLWERSPHLAFAIYTVVTLLLFFGGMFGLIYADCPAPILAIYLIGIWVVCIALAVYRNEMCNLSKSTAFVEWDGVLYSVKLGYAREINYQTMGSIRDIVLMGATDAHNAAVAAQVQSAEKEVRERRKYAEAYCSALESYLHTHELPGGVIEIVRLADPHIEKKTAWSMYISYQAGSERKIRKYRNAYALNLE
ncbi:MAG: hypothetical protein LIO67_08345 [Lachnospiraceae bacterium]|nr:hypothetical protein [Lachnospiraceae bacterium]